MKLWNLKLRKGNVINTCYDGKSLEIKIAYFANSKKQEGRKSIQNTDAQRGAPYEEELFARLPSTKTAYSIILSNSYSIPTAERRILNYGTIRNVYMLPFQILKEPKLIFFQFKITHNILPTQSNLFRAGIKDTDICPLCNSECQSLTVSLPNFLDSLDNYLDVD